MSVYGNSYRDPRYQVVQEAYFGKSDTLLKIEEQIGKIRDNFKMSGEINNSPEVLELNNLFQKQFGMDLFALHVVKADILNAYTYPIGAKLDIAFGNRLKKHVKATKKDGYRFTENNHLCIVCTIYSGLLTNKEITNGEIVAIILHELGHNFADAISGEIASYNKGLIITRLLLVILRTIATAGALLPIDLVQMYTSSNSYEFNKESNKKSHPIQNKIDAISAPITKATFFMSDLINRLTFGAGNWLFKALSLPTKITGSAQNTPNKKNEVIADKFAGIYGYGPEQASALIKMDKTPGLSEKLVEKIPIIGPLMNLSVYNSFKDYQDYDAHPHVIQRLNSEITTIKDELNKKDVNKDLAKVMKAQIEELEKLKDEAMKVSQDATMSERSRAAYYGFVEKKFPDPIMKSMEKELDKAIDKCIEK